MRVFKRTYRDIATGKMKEASKWYVEFFDQKHELVRQVPGYTDKDSTKELGRRLEKLSAFAASHREPDAELRSWLETLPGAFQDRLLRFGLIDGLRAASAQPLSQNA